MGLGKTFSVVALSVVLLTHPDISYNETQIFSRILVVAPVNTIENWKQEFKKWVPESIRNDIPVHRIQGRDDINSRVTTIEKWFDYGGICILGYDMFRYLVEIKPSSPGDTNRNSAYHDRLQKVSI
jgi:transcriptional regulator ATRX